MGLDLFHSKAAYKIIDRDYYLEKDFSSEALEKYGFKKYVQDIPDTEVIYTIVFLPSQKIKKYIESFNELNETKPENVIYLVGEPKDNESQIIQIEQEVGLDRDKKSYSPGFNVRLFNEKLGDISFTENILYYFKDIFSRGIYYIDAGYQRKNMIQAFYDDYSQSEMYVNKEDFENLFDYIDDDADLDVIENLIDNFINNYEEGCSFLHFSY